MTPGFWQWMNIHIYVVSSSGKIICPGIAFSSWLSSTRGKAWGPLQQIDTLINVLISLWDVWYPTNSWQIGPPQNHGHTHCCGSLADHSLCLFLPLSAACRNILCRIIALWGVPSSHLGYSSKKSPMSIWHSASWIEVLFSSAKSWATWVL